MKFRSSMTLFSRATADNEVFVQALTRFCGGKPDELTVQLLEGR